MKLLPADIKKYPKFHQYVSVAIPTVASMKNIINALKKFSGNSSETKIKDALAWNRGPTIKIVTSLICGTNDDGTPLTAVGCYRDGIDILEIEEAIVSEFEAGKGARKAAAGNVYLVGVTLLHELCHWANDGTGASDLTHEKFEQTLYGKVIN